MYGIFTISGPVGMGGADIQAPLVAPTYQGSTPTDSESERLTPNNMTSISSLIGNHPVDDILYLHCKRCQSSSGSVHAFRKHFRNVHGHMPSSDDVLIQSIKATKEYVASRNEASLIATPPRLHCGHCGWQCEQSEQTQFTRHFAEHHGDNIKYPQCYYCKEKFPSSLAFKKHLVYHTRVYQYPCGQCCLSFQLEEQLASHMSTNHGISYAHNQRLPHVATVAHVSPSYVSLPSLPSLGHSLSQPVSSPSPRMKPNHSLTLADQLQAKAMQELSGAQKLNQGKSDLASRHSSGLLQTNDRDTKPNTVSSSISQMPVLSTAMTHNRTNSAAADSTQAANTPISSTGSRNQINLMYLLDQAVEEGLRSEWLIKISTHVFRSLVSPISS